MVLTVRRLVLLLLGPGVLAFGTAAGNANAAPRIEPKPRFTHLSTRDGLSSPLVRCVLQDRQGFMWFGTVDGLNRFDGMDFKVYRPEPRDERSLSHPFVWTVYEDRNGTLWVGTEGGLDRYDRETDGFDHFRHDPRDIGSLPDDRVMSLLEDRTGALWVGTKAGLARMDPATGVFRSYSCDPEGQEGLGGVLDIQEDAEAGLLWVGTWRPAGMSVLDPETGRVTRYRHDPGDPSSLGASELVSQVYRDRAGTWWLGSTSGLDRFDREKGAFTHFRHSPGDPASLADDRVRRIHEDAAGRFWVSTLGGLDLLDRRTGTFAHVRHDPGDPESFAENAADVIYEDGTGSLWISTVSQGVDRLSGGPPRFVSHRADRSDPDGVSEDVVTSLHVDRAGNLWFGALREGLNRFDGERYRRFRHDPGDPRSLSSGQVSAIADDGEGHLWAGTTEGVLNRFDGKGFLHYEQRPRVPGRLGGAGGGITFLFPADGGGLWIGLGPWGIDHFDGAKFTHYRPDEGKPDCVPGRHVVRPARDEGGSLWLSREGHGLVRFDPLSGRFACYPLDPDHPRSAINRTVQVIHSAGADALWVGTSTGLVLFRPSLARFTEHYSRQDGLPADGVSGILDDGRGNLWLGTLSGISRFNPASRTFRNYDDADGLPSRQLVDHSSARAPDGRMFFGTLRGAVEFHPDRLPDNPHRPRVVLTSFELWNVPVKPGRDSPLHRPIELEELVALRHDQSVFTFKFAALDFASPKKNRYAYRLEGFDDRWRLTGAERRFATYTNLSPGTYRFRVRASNNDGVWNETGREITVVIVAPWWRTGWFAVLAAAAVAGLALGGYTWRIRSLRRRTEELELQVADRTRELSTARAAIAQENVTLFEALRRSNLDLTVAYDATLEGWSRALDLRDQITMGHTRRVTELTVRLADVMGIPEAERVHVRRGALLHDIGKMGIPDRILRKAGPLSPDEWDVMRQHPLLAFDMLQPIPYLREALDIPLRHHERWDGSGYPGGLERDGIPLPARIFAVVDVWDAITHDRPYRKAWGDAEAADHIRSLSGSHFDPVVVDAFLALVAEGNGPGGETIGE